MSKLTKINIILSVFIVVISFVGGIYVESFIQSGFKKFEFDIALILEKRVITMSLLATLILICFLILNTKASLYKRLGKSKDIDIGLENSHFMTKREIRKNYSFVSFNSLENTQSGIVVGALDKRADMKVTIASGIHTLVIGNTGSGKTAAFVSPNIQILSMFKDKPSMIIADPKGELLDKHSKILKEQGYEIQVIDLINPLYSTRWNPLSPIYERYQTMLKLDESKAFEKQTIIDEVFDELNELVKCIFKADEKSHDKMWEQGMQNFILAVLLAMLEDSENENNGMTKEKYNLANVRTICSQTENDCEVLKIYFAKRKTTSNAKALANGVLQTSDRTLQSYFTTIAQAMTTFADQSICAFMSENEIVFSNFDEKSTALFLKIPDERQSRYNIASAFFSNVYRELVKKSRENSNSELKRPVYFIIDEFGNLPQIPNIDKMLAVSRSRKIFFMLVLQSYEQLENVYGKVAGDVIKGNCNIEAFIGSKETGTLEAFSRKCGNYSVTSSSISQGNVGDGSASVSVRERPLIYPTELAKLNNPPKIMGNVIVVMSGKKPMRSKFTPDFISKKYVIGKAELKNINHSVFDVDKNFYDITLGENSFQQMDIPEEIIERGAKEIENEMKKPTLIFSKTVVKYLSELDIANEGAIAELMKNNELETLRTLILKGISKAKSKNNNHYVTVLNNELNIFERIIKTQNNKESE